jgi:hypothetical protein
MQEEYSERLSAESSKIAPRPQYLDCLQWEPWTMEPIEKSQNLPKKSKFLEADQIPIDYHDQ